MRPLLVGIIAAVLFSQPLGAYIHFNITERGQSIVVKWQRMPVRWFAKNSGVPGVTASDFQATLSRAFATWQAVPTASISFQFAGSPVPSRLTKTTSPYSGFKVTPAWIGCSGPLDSSST